ncbi:uncharacterized protein LOC133296940 [Gastrolobium bilobum]|uniref:uncharacterized protein LOC133296940 n=1 Tax=Gastrolobium bilobum TaxID=150636 RepID=UPI002AB0A4D6|nr:uncharacterized protein LOC133296940 [Gastrolobium bilobum]
MRWEKVESVNPTREGPGKRWGHTCNAVKGGKLLYLFGGYGQYNCQTNQIHVFDTVKQSWSQPVIKGLPPTPRDSHSCTLVGENLFVFGGTDGTKVLNDLHVLDTSSHTWISPTVRGEEPEPREGHSAALVGKRLFVFGGCGKSADNIHEVYYNDLYILNTETFVWKCATTSGTAPSPRDSHTCSSWKNKIIVIGGEDERDYYLSDVHILDTDTLIWRDLCMSGQLLTPRAGHSTVSFGKNLFVFGGFTHAQSLYNDMYMLDVDTGMCTKVTTTPNGPSPRFSVAGDCLDPFKGGVLVFIGGCNKNLEALDDMYYLYTGIARENELRPEKLSLRKQLKLKCQEQNLNLVENQVLVRYGMGRLNIPVNQSLPPSGKEMFQASLTQNISGGYTIETVIDGKLLRGILFSNKPNTLNPATLFSRKRTSGETVNVVSNGVHPKNIKTSKVFRHDGMDDISEVQGGGSESHEHHMEAVAAIISSNPTSTGPSETIKVSLNWDPETVSLNQSDDEKNGTPKSLGENLKNDRANDVIRSEGEVQTDDNTNAPTSNDEVPRLPRHDQKSDAPNCNTDVT